MLIPAYRPGRALPALVRELRQRRPEIPVVVVDDGSGPCHDGVFASVVAAGGSVIGHPTNRGKGAALRTGIVHVRRRYPGRHVISADADGQHAAEDVLAVVDEVEATGELTLGVRAFDGSVPARSRFGNAVTRQLFRVATGRDLSDTQTGLRGYPSQLLGWLTTIPGDRYEYELSVLLRASQRGIGWRTVGIRTIYADGNATSHFRPVIDSVRIYRPLLAFAASSLLAFAVDTVTLVALHAATGSLGFSVLAARIASAGVNFAVNRSVVFRRGSTTPWRRAAGRYLALAGALLGIGYLLLAGLTGLGLPLLLAKVLTDSLLFGVSFLVQGRLVFDGGPAALPAGGAPLSQNSQATLSDARGS